MPRPRKPVSQLVNPKKIRLEKRLAELSLPAGPLGEAPKWLKPDARDEWDRLTGHEQYSKVLNPIHRGTVIEYCVLYGRMVENARDAGKFSAAERQMLQSLRMQLGITPASQTKVRMPEVKPNGEEKQNSLRMFLTRKRAEQQTA